MYSDPVLNHIDDNSSLSKVPICRFAYPNFAQLVSDNVLKHVQETEQTKYQNNNLQTNIEWINEQIDDPTLLKGVKIGVLGLGKLGKHIAKTFKVNISRRSCACMVFFCFILIKLLRRIFIWQNLYLGSRMRDVWTGKKYMVNRSTD